MTCIISKEVQFDAGHRVPGHQSKCKNPHGHRYRVVAYIEGEINNIPGHPEEGMLKDFGFLKDLLMTKVHDVLDHGFIVYEGDERMLEMFENDWTLRNEADRFKIIVFPYVPTAENIARWCHERLYYDIVQSGYNLKYVEVWETPTSMAAYGEGDII